MAEMQFLFDNQLISEVENLIKNSKHKLVLISPFIDLDKRIQDALREKISKHDFELLVLFGKNEDNLYKSIKKDSLDFLKQFPNIEIRYNERLHAKFYQNDFDFIITSLNLYDYSLAKNIEVGIMMNYASKGLIGNVFDGAETIINHGVEKVKQDVLGMGKDINPLEKFKTIFENSELKYKTEPIKVEQNGLKGFFGAEKLDGFKVIVDELNKVTKEIKTEVVANVSNKSLPTSNVSIKTVSASELSKSLNVSKGDVENLMQKHGLINGDKITLSGQNKGLVMKKHMGRDYIAYPENLIEFREFAK